MGKLKAVHLRIEVGCVSEEYDNVRGGMVGFPMRNMGLVFVSIFGDGWGSPTHHNHDDAVIDFLGKIEPNVWE